MEKLIKKFLSGDGYGYGYGNGDGNGDGNGNGNGDGNGYGDGVKLKTYKGKLVYYVDGIPCVFSTVNKNLLFAKVNVINISDMSASQQFIYKFNGCFAHGYSLRDAKSEAENKYYSQLDVSERITAFNSSFKKGVKYSAKQFYEWHTTLTGSCTPGKNMWISQRGINLDIEMTVEEFIDLTKDSYGGEIIRQLKR